MVLLLCLLGLVVLERDRERERDDLDMVEMLDVAVDFNLKEKL